MTATHCPVCNASNVRIEEYEAVLERNGQAETVRGLRRFHCLECESVFIDDGLSRYNVAKTDLAFGQGSRYVTADALRDWRASLEMTQRQAARILGGGVNAFSKYETGDVVPSDAMDNLLWLCMRYSGLVVELAKRRGVALPANVLTRCGRVAQAFTSAVQKRTELSIHEAAKTGGFHEFKNWRGTKETSVLTFDESANDRRYALQDQA